MRPAREDLPVWILALLLGFALACFAATHPLLATDAICRHGPMVEDFTAGRWSMAFHPRFGIGLPIVAGIVRLLTFNQLDGLGASCFVATFAWALGAIPVFGIGKTVFDRRTAWFAVIVYLICPQTLLWGLKGLREPFKLLGVLLATEAVLKAGWPREIAVREGANSTGWGNVVRAGIGFALLAWFKVDSVILLPCFGLAFAFGDRWSRKTGALVGASVLILIPNCLLVYDWSGVFLPALQYADIWRKLL